MRVILTPKLQKYGLDMKLICENGFYKFFPDFVGEIKLWENKNGIRLYKMRDFWTFQSLAEFPNYSFAGQFVHGIIPALVNYAGSPEEVLKKNELTYNLKLGTITPRALVFLQRLQYAKGAYLTFPNIPQAYALDQDLQRVSGFEAFVDVRLNTYKIERLIHEDF